MYKIGIAGVHSAGKTSLAYLLSAHYKMKNINVKLIHESVRENCPFPINEQATAGTCLWNFHKQFLNELEAEAQGYELSVCDRSVMDTFVYFHAVNKPNKITSAAVEQAAQWLSSYDVIILLSPSEGAKMYSDGVRSVDEGYQKIIDKEFNALFNKYSYLLESKILKITSEDVFSDSLRDELIKKVDKKILKYF